MISAIRFNGTIALNTKAVGGHAKVEELAQAAGTEPQALDERGKCFAIKLSEADDPQRVTIDKRFIMGHLAADNLPFAYDPTNGGNLAAAADTHITTLEGVTQMVEGQNPFQFHQPTPTQTATKAAKPPKYSLPTGLIAGSERRTRPAAAADGTQTPLNLPE